MEKKHSKNRNKRLRESLFRLYVERNKSTREQMLFDRIFGTVFAVCFVLLIPALSWACGFQSRGGYIMLAAVLGCLLAAIGYSLCRKKRMMKKIFPVGTGEERIEKTEAGDPAFFESLHGEPILLIRVDGVPDAEFFNMIYNWLNGLAACEGVAQKWYLLRGRQLKRRFHWDVEDDVPMLCIPIRDLGIGEENARRLEQEVYYLDRLGGIPVLYLKDGFPETCRQP